MSLVKVEAEDFNPRKVLPKPLPAITNAPALAATAVTDACSVKRET